LGGPHEDRLTRLTEAVHHLLGQPQIIQTIDRLKRDVGASEGPFVWSVIGADVDLSQLPADIKSAWIFVLKKDTPSICHFHPNSIQHMAVIEGSGSAAIDGVRTPLRRFDTSRAIESLWTVIDKNVPHEFFPDRTDMVVLSFHTCAADDLIEIECGTGRQRRYEASP
jgi:hypothetical protein